MSIKKRIKNRLSEYQSLAVWGAGGLGRLAMKYWLPTNKVNLVVDSNNYGGRLAGIVVNAPKDINLSKTEAVIICTGAHLSVLRDLRNCGYKGHAYYIYELFLPTDGVKLNELQALAVDIAVTKNDPWPLFLMLKPQILVNITFRLGGWANQGILRRPLYWVIFIFHQLNCILFSIQLPLGTNIGPGLLFAHYGTVVFTRRAQIGAFFTVYHGCTIGTNDSGQGPIIGNYVFQYAGSHVLGRCKLGDHCRIGANAVALNLACEPRSTIVGIPAHAVTHG